MRVPFTRRAAIAASIVAIAMAPLAACSSDDDSSSESSTSAAATTSAAAETTSAAAAAGAPADAATTQAITDAYTTFFNGTADPAARGALVEDPAAISQGLQGMTTNPQAGGTTATVGAVTLVDPTHATVTWTLNMNGAPVLPDQAGEAVNVNGTWKVANSTVCALLAIAGGGGPTPGC